MALTAVLTYHAAHVQVDGTEQSQLSFQLHLVQQFSALGRQRLRAQAWKVGAAVGP